MCAADRPPAGGPFVCIICHFTVECDDVALRRSGTSARVVCTRCFWRETVGEHPMPKPLRRLIEGALGEVAEGL